MKSLYSSIDQDHLSHAVLLHGKNGYGALSIALGLARALVCDDRQDGGACGQCSACHKSDQNIHPDIHFAMPVVSKAGQRRDKTTSIDYLSQWREALSETHYLTIGDWIQQIATQSARADINVAECNHIFQQLSLQSFESVAKVQIIWMAEYLGNNGNRLLKLIEEPPANTYIIMVCEDLDAMLGTIRSRCRVIKIPRIDEYSVSSFLQNQYSIPGEQAQKITKISEGDLTVAQGLVKINNEGLLKDSLTMFLFCQQGDLLRIKKWVDHYATLNTQEQKAILSYQLKLIREMLHSTANGSAIMNLSDDEIREIQKTGLQSLLTVDVASRLSEIISDALYRIDRNAHIKTLMYHTCLEIEQALKN